MLAAIAVTGFVLSLGTRTPVYGWVFHVFPADAGAACRGAIRQPVPARHGGARRPRAWPACAAAARRAARLLAGIVLVALANLESLRAPFHYTRFDGIPAIYSLLAEEPGRVVLVETPFYPAQAVFENAELRPRVDGALAAAHERLQWLHPGLVPHLAASFWFFPEDYAIQEMRKAGVTHVMVHPPRFYQDAAA